MDIKGMVEKLIKKYNTNNPFYIAESLGVNVIYEELGCIYGYFDMHFRIKTIHINSKINERMHSFVCAHELGHAILHNDINTPFLSKNTLFSIDKYERQANTFAVELLLPDYIISEYDSLNIQSLATMHDIPQGLECLKSDVYI